jgi:hypothetical protein
MLPTLVDASTQAWIDTLNLLLARHADPPSCPAMVAWGKRRLRDNLATQLPPP